MELSARYEIELRSFEKAVSSLEIALGHEYSDGDAVVDDLIRNGKIQKFEYCAELAWKLSKLFLEVKAGVIASSPKAVYKGLFQNDLTGEELYERLFATVEDRNKLSHIYKEEMFESVYVKLPEHLEAFKELVGVMKG